MQGFHNAIVLLKRHHYGIAFGVAAADNGHVGILKHTIQNGLKAIS
jgi:hypothetical protein